MIGSDPDPKAPPIALAIAGFDPSSGAGITADLKTFAAHQVYGVSCITAITVQSTQGVRGVSIQPAGLVRQTLDCLADDLTLAGAKIGMLGSLEVAVAVRDFLESASAKLNRGAVVLDPVIRSSSGAPLIDSAGISFIQEELLRWVGWITPNIDELAILTGSASVVNADGVVASARALQRRAAACGNAELRIVVTGGHLETPDDFLLTASGEGIWLPGQRVATTSTHGTGCAFSSALLCEQIAGHDPQSAVARAKAYVTEALRRAYPVGKGKGPMNHLFSLQGKDRERITKT